MIDWNWRNYIRESICVTFTSSQDLLENDWMKELGSEVAGGSEDSQQIQPKSQNPLVRTGNLLRVSNHLVRLLRRSKKMSCFGCESTNVSTERTA